MAGFRDNEVREALGLETPVAVDGRTGEAADASGAAADAAAGPAAPAYTDVSTDTRTLEAGQLFVALEGERFDGHEFLAEAAANGARGAVVRYLPDDAPEALRYYRVDDTLVALGELARFHRRRLGARVCAITGTNGKTTTKEMTAAVLGATYRVHATTANLNNLVGAPLTLLSAPDDTEAVVVELGTNAPGEIARLGAIVEPDAVILTGVAEGHLDGLGDLEGVLREKTSLLSALSADGVAVVADEPPELVDRARNLVGGARLAGWTDRADEALRAERVWLDGEGRAGFRWRGRDLQLCFRGRPNARNALLALGIADAWAVDLDDAVRALETLEPPSLRSELHRYGELTVIADCYNANPKSVEAAIDLLLSMPRRGRRIAIVGTMKELGDASDELHGRLAAEIADSEIELIVATGEFCPAFEPLADRLGDRLIRAVEPTDAYAPLRQRMRGDETVLLKGSRGVALERLLPRFEADWAAGGDVSSGPESGTADDAAASTGAGG